MTTYIDSSFLVSLYITDSHSPDARKRITTASPLTLTPLHEAEWAHALAQHIFRKEMLASEARQFDKQFQDDKVVGVWLVEQFPENALEVCAQLGHRFGPRFGLRTLDTLHVACAIEYNADQFWTFDERQRELARSVGLKT